MTTLTEVHLLELPVPLAAKSQEHFREMLREFSLIEDEGARSADVPARLMQLIDVLTRQFAGLNSEAEDRLEGAIAAGRDVIDDHVLLLPSAAAPASQALGDMIDQADAFCRTGKHLLTLETPDECVAYRRWYLGNIVDQVGGGPAVSWSQFQRP